jgi:ABC-type lipoprotein export system ATPase subunit
MTPVLSVQGLRKSYRSPDGETRTVVCIGRFEMQPGTEAALRGGSGSGKTTFLNLVAGIVKADAGTVAVNGVEVSTLGEAQRDRLRATTIGCVYQSFNLLQGFTCLDNVLLAMAFGAGRDRELALHLLDRVGLAHRLAYYPRQLSAGQQQRVAVARALANRPKLVLADEPTGNLDATLAEETLALLRSACVEQGAALLLVSHDKDILARFERVEEFAQINEVTPHRVLQS